MTIKYRGAKDTRVENARKFEDYTGAKPVDPVLASRVEASRLSLTQEIKRHVTQLKQALEFGAATTISAITGRELYLGVKAKLTKKELAKIRFVNFENEV